MAISNRPGHHVSTVFRRQIHRISDFTRRICASANSPSPTSNEQSPSSLVCEIDRNSGYANLTDSTSTLFFVEPSTSSGQLAYRKHSLDVYPIEKVSESSLQSNPRRYGIFAADSPTTPITSPYETITHFLHTFATPSLLSLPNCTCSHQRVSRNLPNQYTGYDAHDLINDSSPDTFDLAEALHYHHETLAPVVDHIIQHGYIYADKIGTAPLTDLQNALKMAMLASYQGAARLRAVDPWYQEKIFGSDRFHDESKSGVISYVSDSDSDSHSHSELFYGDNCSTSPSTTCSS